MPRGSTQSKVDRRATSTPPRSHSPNSGASRGRKGALSAYRLTKVRLVVLPLVTAPFLVFSFYAPVRDWLLGALGYGLIPVTLWLSCFALVLRYKHAWIKHFWRVCVGSALLVAISLGIMSMFNASSGVMKEASLGGYWGQYLGGSPAALGSLKIAFLVLLGPLLLFPRRAAPLYKRVAFKVFRAWATSVKWLAIRTGRSVRTLAMWRWSGSREARGETMPVQDQAILPNASPDSTYDDSRPVPADTFEFQDRPKISSKSDQGLLRRPKGKHNGWELPTVELLGIGEDRQVPQPVLQQMAKHIETALAEHRLEVVVEDIKSGPRVIRFGLVPGWIKKYRVFGEAKFRSKGIPAVEMSRVKVQSILAREKDLALALKTPYLRLEAPVPGESLVGLEVPNPQPCRVVLRTAAESPAFRKIAEKGGLPVALGEDTGAGPVVADLSDLPHLLIAGATGSGKSVCINSIVCSLLLTNPPDTLRMLMVDPKRVELTPFNGIPHLIAPVIVETDDVLVVLKSIQTEMLRRFKLLEETGVRNIEGYNKKAGDRMPFLVLIIDELADLMMSAAYDTEQSLVRLAQLGRAVGIHLILATQRPSVNVVTGLLKANIPSRLAFAVASQVDSRVILDSVGAEKLLGKGDMLLLTSDSPKPKRIQGTFVDDREIEELVKFWQAQVGPPLPEIPLDEHTPDDSAKQGNREDDLLDRARELAGRYHQLSPSVLQRRLQIGYAGAVRLIELLEDEGLVYPSN